MTRAALLYRTKGDANPQADPPRFQLDQPTQAKVAFGVSLHFGTGSPRCPCFLSGC